MSRKDTLLTFILRSVHPFYPTPVDHHYSISISHAHENLTFLLLFSLLGKTVPRILRYIDTCAPDDLSSLFPRSDDTFIPHCANVSRTIIDRSDDKSKKTNISFFVFLSFFF